MDIKLDIELKNLSETEKENLLALVEKALKKPAPYFIPQKEEVYWVICGDGKARFYIYRDNPVDINAFEIGNCFRTREEAREARMRMKMQAKWKRLSLEAGEADNPWDGEHVHWFAYWHSVEGRLETDCNKYTFSYKTYFPTYESLQAAIKELGEQNVIDYIIGDKGALS